MAQMTMKPPTDFAIEPRAVQLALKKRALGRYSNERTPVQVSVYRTLEALHSTCRIYKVEVFLLQ